MVEILFAASPFLAVPRFPRIELLEFMPVHVLPYSGIPRHPFFPLSPLIRYQTTTNRKDCFRLGDVTDPSWEVMDPAKPRKGIVLKCV